MNEVIERNTGYVYLATNTMLEASYPSTKLKELYSPHAVSLANVVRNHILNSKGKVFQIDAHGHGVIGLRKLHPFGTLVWYHVPKRRVKGDPPALEGIYLGPSTLVKGGHKVLRVHKSL